jgi:hypothetical protein
MRRMVAACVAMLPVLLAGGAFAQESAPPGSEMARLRILDICVLADAKRLAANTPVVPRCNCYAKGLSAALAPADLDALLQSGKLPPHVRDDAARIYSGCGQAAPAAPADTAS